MRFRGVILLLKKPGLNIHLKDRHQRRGVPGLGPGEDAFPAALQQSMLHYRFQGRGADSEYPTSGSEQRGAAHPPHFDVKR